MLDRTLLHSSVNAHRRLTDRHEVLQDVLQDDRYAWSLERNRFCGAGTYVMRCHTAAHVDGGMQALYTINASEAATAAALTGTGSSAASSLISTLAFLSQVLQRSWCLLQSHA